MVNVLASSVVAGRSWFGAPIGSNQRLDNWYLLLLRYARSIKEKEQRLVSSELYNVCEWGDMSISGLLFQ